VLPRGRVQRDVLGTTDGFAMWADTKYPEQAWALLQFLNSDDFYAIQAQRLQPARLSWQDRWAQYIVQDNPGLQGKNLRAFTDPIKQGYARPWNLFRYHAAVNQLINDAYEESVNLNVKPIRDTHVALSRQIDEIQQREVCFSFLSRGGARRLHLCDLGVAGGGFWGGGAPPPRPGPPQPSPAAVGGSSRRDGYSIAPGSLPAAGAF
jgi:hypothetical protein